MATARLLFSITLHLSARAILAGPGAPRVEPPRNSAIAPAGREAPSHSVVRAASHACRPSVVPLGMLGAAHREADGVERLAGEVLDGRALLLMRTLAGLPVHDLDLGDPSLTLAARRIANGRLLTALG